MRRALIPFVVATLLATVASACGGGDDDTAGGGFVRSQLALVPADVRPSDGSSLQIAAVDLTRTAAALGLGAPDAARSGDELGRWIGDMSGLGDGLIEVFMPGLLGDQGTWLAGDDVRADTGVALGAAEAIVAADAPPNSFSVTTGDLELGGELDEVADGVVTFGTGDDLTLGEPTPWNRIGQPVRLAAHDGAIAWSKSTELAAEFAGGVDTSLADLEPYGPLADALDAQQVLGAVLLDGDFSAAVSVPAAATPEQRDQILASVPDIPAFSAVGVGVAAVDGAPRVIVAYAFAGEADAAAAVELLVAQWTDSTDPISARPISDEVSVAGSGTAGIVAWVALTPVAGASTLIPARLAFARGPMFAHP